MYSTDGGNELQLSQSFAELLLNEKLPNHAFSELKHEKNVKKSLKNMLSITKFLTSVKWNKL
jgi:hypothetical protein